MKIKTGLLNRYLLLGDLALIIVSVLGTFFLRLEDAPTLVQYLPLAYWMIGISLVVKPLVYYLFGLYRRMWAYASIEELKLIVAAVVAAEIPVTLLMIAVWYLNFTVKLPRSAPLIDLVLSILLVGGLRLSVRILAERERNNKRQNDSARIKKVMIVGAGDAGALVVRELQKNPQLNLVPVGFLDDNPGKQ